MNIQRNSRSRARAADQSRCGGRLLAAVCVRTGLQAWIVGLILLGANIASAVQVTSLDQGGNLSWTNVADRGAHYVYRVVTDGSRVASAGNGTTSEGGAGEAALATGIYGPRGMWAVPTGGYVILLHDGAQLWYVDNANIMHLLVNGLGGNGFSHGGDGQNFYAPDQFNIGEGRSVALDYAGSIISCESDYGFIQRINFHRMTQ